MGSFLRELLFEWPGTYGPAGAAWLVVIASFLWPTAFMRLFTPGLRQGASFAYLALFLGIQLGFFAFGKGLDMQSARVEQGITYGEPAGRALIAGTTLEVMVMCAVFIAVMASPIVAFHFGHRWRRRWLARRRPPDLKT